MWLCALLALAAEDIHRKSKNPKRFEDLRYPQSRNESRPRLSRRAYDYLTFYEAQAFYQYRKRDNELSKSVNLELLIPVAIPTDQLTSDEVTNSQYNRASVRDDTQESGEFSSIPSYAFSYDHKLNSHAASPVETSRSFYLTNIWPRADKDAWEDNEEGLPSPATAGQVACRELAHRQKGRAKELMLYLCEELLDVLRGSCDCCRQQEHRKKYQRVAPWFRSPALRGSPQLRTKNIVNV